MADPRAFGSNVTHLKRGMTISRNVLLRLVDALYAKQRNRIQTGLFPGQRETVDIFPAIETYDGVAYRIEFWDDVIDRISSFNPVTGQSIGSQDELDIYPANLLSPTKPR